MNLKNKVVLNIDSSIYIPREPDKILSGSWGLVAICVTQPSWPFNVPRRVSPSFMMPYFSRRFRWIEHWVLPLLWVWRREEEANREITLKNWESDKILFEGGETRADWLLTRNRGKYTCLKWRGDRHLVPNTVKENHFPLFYSVSVVFASFD